MSQQKPQSWESLQAPKCSLPQEPHPSLAPSSDPCCAPCSGGCGSGPQRSRTQTPATTRRASRMPHCLRGGTVYHIKEEEC
uniref:Late cornified envelope 6A n=1 Tax=Pipistrellus kuhlii TaxID=59472 RepID=A0A7J7TVY3_PIPKU|nr:late cornified envelope 6A [Pipistrellus kuhlii]